MEAAGDGDVDEKKRAMRRTLRECDDELTTWWDDDECAMWRQAVVNCMVVGCYFVNGLWILKGCVFSVHHFIHHS